MGAVLEQHGRFKASKVLKMSYWYQVNMRTLLCFLRPAIKVLDRDTAFEEITQCWPLLFKQVRLMHRSVTSNW